MGITEPASKRFHDSGTKLTRRNCRKCSKLNSAKHDKLNFFFNCWLVYLTQGLILHTEISILQNLQTHLKA
jgi:hypothetical protein